MTVRLTTKHLSHHKNFLQVNLTLIQELGGDGNAAITLTAIEWWTEFYGYTHDGHTWWRADHKLLAERTGFSVDKVRKIITKLRSLGVLVQAKHRLHGTSDHTLSYRIILDDGDVAVPEPHDSADSPDVADPPHAPESDVADPPNLDVADRPHPDVADPPNLPSVESREGGEGRSAPPHPLPVAFPDQCHRHQDDINDIPCHGCRRARELHEAEEAQREAEQRSRPMQHCDEHYATYPDGAVCPGCRADSLEAAS